jgi:glycosyltransferase involved in cell wall biosynthesis
MQVSFVIPAYNEKKYVGKCIASILRAVGGNPNIEIIVVDNASDDRTEAEAGRFPGVRVVHEPSKGLTCARQRGLQVARGELLAYLDADTEMPIGWLDHALQEFARRPGLVCLSGPFRYNDLPWAKKHFAELCWRVFAPITYRAVGYMVLGANFIAKREALVAIGGFDTDIDFYGEDTNLARRLGEFGSVMFQMDFFIYGSGRRLAHEGVVKTFGLYGLNFVWEVIFHRPFTREHKDIR